MVGIISIDALRMHLDYAKDRLSLEKAMILQIAPLSKDFNREEYAFAYVRAERVGMQYINQKLAEIAWLPMQLDPSSELLAEGRASMKRWLTASLKVTPDSHHFGNDFVHALTRTGINYGFENREFMKLALRVANIFRDLSCLIGIVYYCTWLTEHGIRELPLSNPSSLNRTAEEIAVLLQSPEIYARLVETSQDTETEGPGKNQTSEQKPFLYVIENKDFSTTETRPLT